MASRSGYKRQWISATHSVATSALIPHPNQHIIESDSASFSEHSDADYFEVEPPSPKQTRTCNHDNVPVDNFDAVFESICCNTDLPESNDSYNSE